MIKSFRTVTLVLACAFALAAFVSIHATADDTASPTQQGSQVAPAPSQQPSTMTGCPGMPEGGCCGSCQNQMAKPEADAGEQATGGCPCQRARERMKQEQGS